MAHFDDLWAEGAFEDQWKQHDGDDAWRGLATFDDIWVEGRDDVPRNPQLLEALLEQDRDLASITTLSFPFTPTPEPTPRPTPSPTPLASVVAKSHSISSGGIAGAVIGATFGAILLGVGAVYFVKASVTKAGAASASSSVAAYHVAGEGELEFTDIVTAGGAGTGGFGGVPPPPNGAAPGAPEYMSNA